MNIQKLIIVLLACFGACTAAHAQFTLGNQSNQGNRTGLRGDMRGNVVSYDKYAEVTNGSPYAYSYWNKASIAGTDGRLFPEIYVKLDLVTGEVLYLDEKGTALLLTTPVVYMRIKDSLTGKDVEWLRADYFTNKVEAGLGGWLEILEKGEQGEALLLRQLNKVLRKSTPYGMAVTEVNIDDKTAYVAAIDKKAALVRKTKEAADFFIAAKPALSGFKPTQKQFEAQLKEWVRAYNQPM